MVLDFDDDDEDVTQDDIDALLLETDDDDEDDEDILISQDDIDTILMAADEDDEDVLGDLMDNDDTDLDGDFEDEDILENDDSDDFDDDDDYEEYDEDGEDQVVLEGDDELVKKKVKKKRKIRLAPGWYKSKLVIASVSALIVLGITVPMAYFLFFKGESPAPVAPMAQTTPAQPIANMPAGSAPQGAVETVEVTIEQPAPRISGNMVLSDFVVLAPISAKQVSYVSVDVSIDYSDQRAYHEIQNNLSFYRDLIYDSIKKRLLVTKDQQEVTEADILLVIETTLKKVIPGDYIDRVSFKSFKIS